MFDLAVNHIEIYDYTILTNELLLIDSQREKANIFIAPKFRIKIRPTHLIEMHTCIFHAYIFHHELLSSNMYKHSS